MIGPDCRRACNGDLDDCDNETRRMTYACLLSLRAQSVCQFAATQNLCVRVCVRVCVRARAPRTHVCVCLVMEGAEKAAGR